MLIQVVNPNTTAAMTDLIGRSASAAAGPGTAVVAVDDMYSMAPTGRYWFRGGYNPNAVIAVIASGVPTILLTLFASVGDYGWFIGCALGFVVFAALARMRPMIPQLDPAEAGVSDGTQV